MSHPKQAAEFNADLERTQWHDETLWLVREKRDTAAGSVPGWEDLRERASQIKGNALSRLDDYLKEFEQKAVSNGIHVHWASDAAEHNGIVLQILKDRGAKHLVKSKSMLTEECQLNPYLHANGIEVIDTDLGERIVQIADEAPSHIVMPAIHMRKEEVGDLFHDHLGSDEGATDPDYLTEVARQSLRKSFLEADAALTGVNFAVAETGGFVVCTNEGNADLGVHLAPVHIASMGIEKIIPRADDLGVFLRLLARSATGQDLTVYTSHFHGPRPGAEMHLVLVDNGRSARLGQEEFRDALKCIRCGACMNTCPVYRRSGGHSYGWTVPGPLGSVLAPHVDMESFSSLPFASTLCGSCTDVCPVKIDLHGQLYAWRQKIVAAQKAADRPLAMRLMARVLARPLAFRISGWFARRMLRRGWTPAKNSMLSDWTSSRDLPSAPEQSFRSWYLKNRKVQ